MRQDGLTQDVLGEIQKDICFVAKTRKICPKTGVISDGKHTDMWTDGQSNLQGSFTAKKRYCKVKAKANQQAVNDK